MPSDVNLFNAITEKLDYEPSVDPSRITIKVDKGIVTLGGFVNNYLEKHATVRAVQNLDGVKAIVDNIAVHISQEHEREDADIAKAAINTLVWDALIPKDKIKVVVENGRVILKGEVDWWYQRERAEKIIQGLAGVKSINNQILIKPKVFPAQVKEKILKEFERNAEIDANGIEVEAKGEMVILRGVVHSWLEYREATRAAWSVPGVAKVDNRLEVVS